jgi:hypothetical protein
MNNLKIKQLLRPIVESIISEIQTSKPISGKMYSYYKRTNDKETAKQWATAWINKNNKHAYVAKVKERGNEYFDVRTEN